MSRQQNKLTTIKGCAVWYLANGTPINPTTPNADNVTITLPDLSFSTTDVNILGTLSVPDFTRIDNFSVSINIANDNPDSAPLKQIGLQEWKITYCIGVINSATGLEQFIPYTIYCKGYISSIPLGTIEQGGDGLVEISMNCTSIKKQQGTETLFEIDRLNGKIKIGDTDYSSSINSLY